MKTEQEFKEWSELVKQYHPKADNTVLKFIFDFLNMQYAPHDTRRSDTIVDGIYTQFANGYCYYFAQMLQTAFHRGEICWAAPFGHIVWLDDNNVAYDISGCNDSECQYYIPVFMLGDMLKDFLHIPDDNYNASDQEIANAILEWEYIINTPDDVKDDILKTDVRTLDLFEAFKWLEKKKDLSSDVALAKQKYLKRKYNL